MNISEHIGRFEQEMKRQGYSQENKYNEEDLRTSFVSGMESMLNDKLSSEELFQILINKINKHK